jgi:hypothetical protein
MAGLLDRERIIAGPGINRWLVPPAAGWSGPGPGRRVSWPPSAGAADS